MDIEQTVKDVFSKQLGVEISEIDLNSDIVDDLGADSLDVVETIMSLEDQFDCLINDELIDTFRTVGDVVEWIKQNKGKNHG